MWLERGGRIGAAVAQTSSEINIEKLSFHERGYGAVTVHCSFLFLWLFTVLAFVLPASAASLLFLFLCLPSVPASPLQPPSSTSTQLRSHPQPHSICMRPFYLFSWPPPSVSSCASGPLMRFRVGYQTKHALYVRYLRLVGVAAECLTFFFTSAYLPLAYTHIPCNLALLHVATLGLPRFWYFKLNYPFRSFHTSYGCTLPRTCIGIIYVIERWGLSKRERVWIVWYFLSFFMGKPERHLPLTMRLREASQPAELRLQGHMLL